MKPSTIILRPGVLFDRLRCNAIDLLSRLDKTKLWKITIEPFSDTRSQQQNRYLWGVCYATLEASTGQEAEDWHEYMLGEWSGWETVSLLGKRKLKPARRSSKLSKVEFMDYVGFIQRRAAENGIYIADPDIAEAA